MGLVVDRNGLPILDQFSEEDFVDCVFRIEGLKSVGDYWSFHMSASFEGERLGADVRVLKKINAGFDAGMNQAEDGVHRNGVVFQRSGPESDRLISAIARRCGMDGAGLTFAASESFTIVALHQGEIDLEREIVKIKLFGREAEPEGDENYHECYFNLDLPNGLVHWNEKDPGYREPLLRALGGML
jgi:hypothetical protein